MKRLSYTLISALLVFSLFFFAACNKSGSGKTDASLEGPSDSSEDGLPDGSEGGLPDSGEGETQQNALILHAVTSPVSLAKPITTSYLSSARVAYRLSDHTTSIISGYTTLGNDYNDRPRSLTLSFSGIEDAVSYVLELSPDDGFKKDVRTLTLDGDATHATVSNLYTGTVYFWRVTALRAEGDVVISDVSSFTTATDAVRWIAVEGVRNVRDIGGWTGLNQGMVYRGSEMNPVASHGLAITDAGRAVMQKELGIKTDLDFRAASENGSAASPIGEGVRWCNKPIGGFLSAFSDSYRLVLKEFADPDNYPIYMHCWGGADRTGTVAMVLEGLCGVKEEDLAADLELTSFSSFGYRYRYDNGAYLFASTLTKIKTDYKGASLEEKFEAYALDLGLTRAEISNIRSLLAGTGATFDEDSLSDLFLDPAAGGITFSLRLPNGQSVSSVRLGEASVSFTASGGTLTISAKAVESAGVTEGILTVTLSDGQVLRTDFSSTPEAPLGDRIASGELRLLFNDGAAVYEDGGVKKASGSLVLTHDALRALLDAGYTSLSFRASAELTGTVSATDTRIRLLARWRSGGGSYLSFDKQDLTADTYPKTVDGTLTVHLSEDSLGTDNVFTLVPQSGCNIALSNFSFHK